MPADGSYYVYARWSANTDRAPDAKYTVAHDGGVTDVPRDQTAGGGQWQPLGSFDFTPGLGQGVTVFGADGAAYPYIEVTADNLDPGISKVGSWAASTWTGGGTPYVRNFNYLRTGTGANSFTWPLAVPADGAYEVYARWSANTDRAPDAKYTVAHDGGSTTVVLDQTTGGGIWNLLGSFALTAAGPHGVTLSDNASGTFVIADAVKAVRVAGGSPSHDAAVDNTDPGVTKVGSWPTSGWTAGGIPHAGNFAYHTTGTGANAFTWPVAVPADGSYQVYASWSGYSNRAPDAKYTIAHAGGSTTVTVDQTAGGGRWNLLGGFTFTAAGPHSVTLSDEASGTYVTADAIRLVSDTVERPVVAADAVRFEQAATPSFPVVASSLLDEVVYLGGRPLALIDGGTLYYVHTDHLGTPQKMTDANGNLVWDAVYRPFGEAESVTGSASLDLRFPGQLYDEETGFHYNYFRDYAPGLGRYLESDPIGLGGGVNTYVYVLANPLRNLDSYGAQTTSDLFTCAGSPIDCISSYNCAVEASNATTKKYGGSGLNDASDAYRHCYWNCCMAQQNGMPSASEFGNAHEDFPGNDIGQKNMDQFNNAIGQTLGGTKPSGNCDTLCGGACLQNAPNTPTQPGPSQPGF